MASDAALAHLQAYRESTEQLFEALRAGSSIEEPFERLLAVDEGLQSAAVRLIAEADAMQAAAASRERALERDASFLRTASSAQRAEEQLARVIERAHSALATADGLANASVDDLVHAAERVSYSSAAPTSEHAFGVAARDGFRRGWGTPAPQQHMLACSRFAALGRQREGGAAQGDVAARAAEAADEAAWKGLVPSHAAATAPRAGGAACAPVSLDLNPDEDDDDAWE